MVKLILAIHKISHHDLFGTSNKRSVTEVVGKGLVEEALELRERLNMDFVISLFPEANYIYGVTRHGVSVLIHGNYTEAQRVKEVIRYHYRQALEDLSPESFLAKKHFPPEDYRLFGITVFCGHNVLEAAKETIEKMEEYARKKSDEKRDERFLKRIIAIPFHTQEQHEYEEAYIVEKSRERVERAINYVDAIVVSKINAEEINDVLHEHGKRNNIELILTGIRDERFPVKDDDQAYTLNVREARNYIEKYRIEYVWIGRPIIQARKKEEALRYFREELGIE